MVCLAFGVRCGSTSRSSPAEARRARLVRRPTSADPSLVRIEQPENLDVPWPAGGAFSTARDVATFGQMFLQEGAYGTARVLSPASVAAMTRNQIPGIALRF